MVAGRDITVIYRDIRDKILGDFLRRFSMDLFFRLVTEAAGLFFAASSAAIASAEMPVVVDCEPVLARVSERPYYRFLQLLQLRGTLVQDEYADMFAAGNSAAWPLRTTHVGQRRGRAGPARGCQPTIYALEGVRG